MSLPTTIGSNAVAAQQRRRKRRDGIAADGARRGQLTAQNTWAAPNRCRQTPTGYDNRQHQHIQRQHKCGHFDASWVTSRQGGTPLLPFERSNTVVATLHNGVHVVATPSSKNVVRQTITSENEICLREAAEGWRCFLQLGTP